MSKLFDEMYRDVFCELSVAIWQRRRAADHARIIDRALKKHARIGLVIGGALHRAYGVQAEGEMLLIEIEQGEIVRQHIDAARWRFF